METKDFARDPSLTALAQQHLVEGERLVALLRVEHRDIIQTSERLILVERSGGWSVIRNSQIAAVEVSPGRGREQFVKVLFGGGLSRQLSTPDEEQARVLAGALAFG